MPASTPSIARADLRGVQPGPVLRRRRRARRAMWRRHLGRRRRPRDRLRSLGDMHRRQLRRGSRRCHPRSHMPALREGQLQRPRRRQRVHSIHGMSGGRGGASRRLGHARQSVRGRRLAADLRQRVVGWRERCRRESRWTCVRGRRPRRTSLRWSVRRLRPSLRQVGRVPVTSVVPSRVRTLVLFRASSAPHGDTRHGHR
jgi:hypothetical protein